MNSKMLKACSRCGRIHDHNHKCYANSKNYYQHNPEIRKFRNSRVWKSKAEEIKQRDKYLCQVCMSKNIFNYKELETHHIVPLSENWDLRLDNNNLITLCEKCHKEAEVGKIPRTELQKIVDDIMDGY